MNILVVLLICSVISIVCGYLGAMLHEAVLTNRTHDDFYAPTPMCSSCPSVATHTDANDWPVCDKHGTRVGE